MVTFVSWVITILIIVIIAFFVIFIFQYKNIKTLKYKVSSLENKIKIGTNNECEIDFETMKYKIFTGTNKELTEFVKEFYWKNSENSFIEGFDKISQIEIKVIEYGLIRMKTLEDSNDLSKFFPPVVVLLLAFVTSYNDFFKQVIFKDSILFQLGFSLMIILGLYLFLTKQIGDTRQSRAAIIYFSGLLQYAKDSIK